MSRVWKRKEKGVTRTLKDDAAKHGGMKRIKAGPYRFTQADNGAIVVEVEVNGQLEFVETLPSWEVALAKIEASMGKKE